MSDIAQHCSRCGRRLAPDSPEGLCGHCLLSGALEDAPHRAEAAEGAVRPPEVDERKPGAGDKSDSDLCREEDQR